MLSGGEAGVRPVAAGARRLVAVPTPTIDEPWVGRLGDEVDAQGAFRRRIRRTGAVHDVGPLQGALPCTIRGDAFAPQRGPGLPSSCRTSSTVMPCFRSTALRSA